MTFKIIAVDTLILYFEQLISEKNLDEVQSVYHTLKGVNGIIDLTPSYCSVLVQFDIFSHDHESIKNIIKQKLVEEKKLQIKQESRVIKIPTDYEKNLDLKRVADHNGLTVEEVITLHSEMSYRVYAIGFMVGFAYLAVVNPKINTPRLGSPRKKVPKGSVALADNQTAIYPQNSSGGWNIMGHTEFTDFHTFEVGDRVQFERV